jgi:hypothetical protein
MTGIDRLTAAVVAMTHTVTNRGLMTETFGLTVRIAQGFIVMAFTWAVSDAVGG